MIASHNQSLYDFDDGELYEQSYGYENFNNQMMDSSYLSNSNYSNYIPSLNDQKLLKLGTVFKPSNQVQLPKLKLNSESVFVPSVNTSATEQSHSLFDSMLPSFESLINESLST